MKQCDICFEEFQETRGNQKYCKTCGKDPERTRKHYEIAEYINKKNAGDLEPVPRENICRQCGKKWMSIYHRTFCSNECLEEHRKNTGKCKECNQLLIKKGIETGRGFCSDECRKASQLRKAKEEGMYIPCKTCGKHFIAKNYSSRFCSRDCFKKYSQENKQTPVPKRIEKRNCLICNKEFICEGKNFTKKFCSRECAYEHSRIEAKKKKDETQKQLKVKDELHICTVCKTFQKDCERFTSNFRYMPQGAVQKFVNDKLIILSCPKYTE